MRIVMFVAIAALAARLAHAGPDAVTPVDDQEFAQKVGNEVTALMEKGALTSIATLRTQLDRKTASVRLPLATSSSPLDPAELYRRARANVLVMCSAYKCGRCSHWHVNYSSAFGLTPDGVIAANFHAIKGTNTEAMAVATSDGRVFPVREVLAASEANDAVLLRADARNLPVLALAPDEPVGRRVSVVSHPDRQFYVMTQGHVSRYYVEHQDPKTSAVRMAITADYAKGSSGGPVFNEAGAVVGMVASTHSIYYDVHNGRQENLQMVIKTCVPARAILDLAGRN